jgi:hypothetical protein
MSNGVTAESGERIDVPPITISIECQSLILFYQHGWCQTDGATLKPRPLTYF